MNKERLSRRKPPQTTPKEQKDTNLHQQYIASLLRSMFPKCEEELFVKIYNACVKKRVN